MYTVTDLVMMFKAETGFYPEQATPKHYKDWLENKLLTLLNEKQ